MIKGFRQIALLTTVSRILGMVRDMAFAHFFGADWLMSAWTMGFKIPNLARRLFGEGAAAASFIPVYSEQLHKDPKTAQRLANTVLTIIFVILAAAVVVGQIIVWLYFGFEERFGARLGLALAYIMLPYMILICIVAILGGILNVHRHFAAPASAPIILNIFIIASILLTGWAFKIRPQVQVFFVAAAVLVAGLAQIAAQLPPLHKSGLHIRPAWDIHSAAFKKIIIMMGPMILGMTVTQLNTLADDIIALSFMNEQGYPFDYGAPSYLYYAQRLYQFPLGVLGISLATAIFPVMSSHAAKGNLSALTTTIARGIRAAPLVALPATAGIFLIAKPLVSAIFEHGQFKSTHTPIVAFTLCCYAAGLCGYFWQQITTRAFYSLQDSKTPVKSALAAVFVNISLNLTLIWFMGTAGLALSTALCSYLQVFILLAALKKRFGGSENLRLAQIFRTLPRIVIATAVMSAGALAIIKALQPLPDQRTFNILRLAVVVPASAVIYILAVKLLRIPELALLTGKTKKETDQSPTA